MLDRGDAPLASVVIPAYNAAASLEGCLAALAQQTLPADRVDVVVVDDGSSDDTPRIARRYPVRVLQQPHAGAAAARNLGTRHARGDIVAYTDADCRPLPDWLEQLITPLLADSGVTATRGVYRTTQTSLVARFVQLEYEERYARAARYASLDFVDTYGAAFRRAAVLACGGFDTTYTGATVEDHELSYRLAAAGHRLLFIPAAAVVHQHVTSPGAYVRRKWRIGRDKVRVHLRHPTKLAGDSHTPWSLRLQIGIMAVLPALGVACPWSRKVQRLLLVLGAAFGGSTLPLIWRAWRHDRRLAPWVPAFVAARAAALAGGLLMGVHGAMAGHAPRAGAPTRRRTLRLAGLTSPGQTDRGARRVAERLSKG